MELRTVAAGRNRSFFVDANGALLACGKEEEGEIGLLGLRGGTSQTSFTAMVPTPVPSMAGVRIRGASCYSNCNLAVSEAGQVFEWGHNAQPSFEQGISWSKWQPPVPTVMEELRNHRVRQVVAGGFHCAALTEDGALFTWETRKDLLAVTGTSVPELGYGSFVHDAGMP
jgi:alpha-tubulin suppressor-like RCC1 family protein